MSYSRCVQAEKILTRSEVLPQDRSLRANSFYRTASENPETASQRHHKTTYSIILQAKRLINTAANGSASFGSL